MSLKKTGFLQALGVAAYCSLIGVFMWSSNNIFGKMNSTLGPIFVLMLLSTSVLICAALVLYKPYKLFVDGKKKEALDTVVSTAFWLFIFSVLFMGGMLIFK